MRPAPEVVLNASMPALCGKTVQATQKAPRVLLYSAVDV